jgi:hypothetical protein
VAFRPAALAAPSTASVIPVTAASSIGSALAMPHAAAGTSTEFTRIISPTSHTRRNGATNSATR